MHENASLAIMIGRLGDASVTVLLSVTSSSQMCRDVLCTCLTWSYYSQLAVVVIVVVVVVVLGVVVTFELCMLTFELCMLTFELCRWWPLSYVMLRSAEISVFDIAQRSPPSLEGGDLWAMLASFLQKEAFFGHQNSAKLDLHLPKKTGKRTY